MVVFGGIRPNQEVRQDAARPGLALSAASACVALKGLSGRAPNALIQLPFDSDTGFPKEGVQKRLGAFGKCHQLGVNGRWDNQGSSGEGSIQSGSRN